MPGGRRGAADRRSRRPARWRSTSTAWWAAPGWSSPAGGWRCGCVNETEVPDGLERTAALRAQPALHPRRRARARREVRLAAGGARLRAGQRLAGARLGRRRRRAGRGDHAPRPPAAGAREPRLAVRLDGDRGGAAAARDGALRRRARGDRAPGPGGAGDARARGARHARGHHGPARARHRQGPRAGGARRRPSTASPTGPATPSCCGPGPAATRRTTWSRAARRRSSGSTSTSRAACSSR